MECPFFAKEKKLFDRACVFIDGENLRYSLKDLFPEEFNRTEHYLPYADWGNMFQAIEILTSRKLGNQLRLIRTYWYVVSEIQYDNFFSKRSKFFDLSEQERIDYFKKHTPSIAKELISLEEQEQNRCLDLLKQNAKSLNSQQRRWREIESTIQSTTDKLQFQRFGYLKAELDNGRGNFRFRGGGEKGTDVKLATDLMSFAFRNIYDIAIIISGDGDYIPVVDAIKNMGKHVVMVNFKSKEGRPLPGGSRKLKEHCDFSFSLNYQTMYDICRYGLEKDDPPKELDLTSEYDF